MAESNPGWLTDSDRELLQGHTGGLSERAEEQRWIRLRRRIRQGIVDMRLIYKHLPREDREVVFSPPPQSDIPPGQISKGIAEMVAFAYLGERQRVSKEVAKQNVESSIEWAEEKLQVEEKSGQIDYLLHKHKEGESLDNDEVQELLGAATVGYISPEDIDTVSLGE